MYALGLTTLCLLVASSAMAETGKEQVDTTNEKLMDEGFAESLRTEVFNPREVPEGVTKLSNYAYTKIGDRDIIADIYYRNEKPAKPRPAIVFLHGGSWMFGNQTQFGGHCAYLALKHDIFAMTVDYRLSGEAKFPAALQDGKCAIRWLRAHADQYNIDPNRIAVSGGSAGGHLTALIGTTMGMPEYEGDGGYDDYSSDVQLAIPINGEFDMWDLLEKKSLVEAMNQFFGGTADEIPEVYNAASPVQHVSKDSAKFLFLHGDQDKCVSHKQAIAMHEKLLATGVHSEIEIYEGKPHAWFNNEPDYMIVLKRLETFLVDQFGLE